MLTEPNLDAEVPGKAIGKRSVKIKIYEGVDNIVQKFKLKKLICMENFQWSLKFTLHQFNPVLPTMCALNNINIKLLHQTYHDSKVIQNHKRYIQFYFMKTKRKHKTRKFFNPFNVELTNKKKYFHITVKKHINLKLMYIWLVSIYEQRNIS